MLGIKVEVCSYWEAYFASESSKQEAKKLMQSGLENIPAHSAEFETSIGLAAFPERIHREGVDYEKVHLELKDPEDLRSDRNYYHDSLLATPEKGEALIRMAVDWLVERLRGMIGNS